MSTKFGFVASQKAKYSAWNLLELVSYSKRPDLDGNKAAKLSAYRGKREIKSVCPVLPRVVQVFIQCYQGLSTFFF